MNKLPLDDLAEFLQSSATNVEWMSDEIRAQLRVATPLEDAVRRAVKQRRNIVIAGTAGSGKTDLIRTVGEFDGYRVVPDLASEPRKEWKDLFTEKAPLLIAGNEGAFLLGRSNNFPGFAEVIELLHKIQRGERVEGKGTVVIDAAGFDPARHHCIAEMVAKPILREYVAAKNSAARTSAWDMLRNPEIRRRLAILVEFISTGSGSEGVTFRQLWQFIADLADSGEGDDGLWFNRIFFAETEISRRIASTLSPAVFALPHVGNRLWHSDLRAVQPAFLKEAYEALLTISPRACWRFGRRKETAEISVTP